MKRKLNILNLGKLQGILFGLLGIVAGIIYAIGGLIIDILVSLDWIKYRDIACNGCTGDHAIDVLCGRVCSWYFGSIVI